MFELPYDVAVSGVDDARTGQFHWSICGRRAHFSGMTPITVAANNRSVVSATADFTGDGYADIIFFLTADDKVTDTTAVVATATDTADPSKELKFENAFTFRGGVDHHISPYAIATGTIAGTLRVLGLGPERIFYDYRCRDTLAVESYSVDPHSLAISSAGTFSLTLPRDACVTSASIAAGRFGTTAHDQVAVAFSLNDEVKIIPIAFDDGGTPSQKAVFDTGENGDRLILVAVWPVQLEQCVRAGGAPHQS